jgi:hypothetical protein
MTQLIEQTPVEQSGETDLAAAVHRVLAASAEPLTLSKIRVLLPPRLRPESLEELATCLLRQVAANVLYQYPKYRSQQDRFWDRPMPVHLAAVLRLALAEGPLAWFELRRKLPAYALPQAEEVLKAQMAQGMLFQHPPAGKRGGERYGVEPPDPKSYLRSDLASLFERLEQLGFSQAQLRVGALELLHEEEWSSAPPQASSAELESAPTRMPPPQEEGPATGHPRPHADGHGLGERSSETVAVGSPQP